MNPKTYLVVYENSDGETNLAKVDLTEEQAFEVECLSAVSHVVHLPLTEDDLEEISVSDALALEAEYDEDDSRWDGDFIDEDLDDDEDEEGELADLDEEDL
jgi:hypothetical protein